MIQHLYGFAVHVDPNLMKLKQYRFPRSRKARIRKKWRKRENNHRLAPSRDVIRFMDKLIMHPDTFRALKIQMEKWK